MKRILGIGLIIFASLTTNAVAETQPFCPETYTAQKLVGSSPSSNRLVGTFQPAVKDSRDVSNENWEGEGPFRKSDVTNYTLHFRRSAGPWSQEARAGVRFVTPEVLQLRDPKYPYNRPIPTPEIAIEVYPATSGLNDIWVTSEEPYPYSNSLIDCYNQTNTVWGMMVK